MSADQTFGSKDIHVVHIGPKEGTEASESKNGHLHQFLSLFWNQIMPNMLQRLTLQSFLACSPDLLNVSLAQGHVAEFPPHTFVIPMHISNTQLYPHDHVWPESCIFFQDTWLPIANASAQVLCAVTSPPRRASAFPQRL